MPRTIRTVEEYYASLQNNGLYRKDMERFRKTGKPEWGPTFEEVFEDLDLEDMMSVNKNDKKAPLPKVILFGFLNPLL